MVYEIELADWKELLTSAHRFAGYAFRGQAGFAWDLSTVIERLGNHFWETECSLANREFWILTQFRRRAQNLIDKPPEYSDVIGWLSLIQHYGGPTRLMDFTTSLFVGLFFACEGLGEDAALWMIDRYRLLQKYAPPSETDTIYHQQSRILEKAKGYIAKETSDCGILPIEPERLDSRMSVQKGLSIMPINIDQTFMTNMMNEFDWPEIEFKRVDLGTLFRALNTEDHPLVAKFRIRAEWSSRILRFLDEANVNANTLFPGLDGFARSLRIHLLYSPPDTSLYRTENPSSSSPPG